LTNQEPAIDTQLEEIQQAIQVLFNPKQLVEVRAMGADEYWHGFYFDDHGRMAEVIKQLDQDPRIQSIYYGFNEIGPKFMEQRAECKCSKCERSPLIKNPTPEQVEKIIIGPAQHLTTNEDIAKIRWLFIDVDTVRAEDHAHDSATKEEKAACKEVFDRVREHLQSKNWPLPLIANSGNGYHVFPKVDQPATPTVTAYVEDCLKALAAKFNCAAAKIDVAVFNPARITRAYGTTTRKGVDTPERPHRRNKIKKPEKLGLVAFDQIMALADEGPATSKAPRGDMPLVHKDFDPGKFFEWFEEQGAFEITGTKNWQGREIYVTDRCIIAGHKHSGSGLTGFVIGDTFGYHCFSDDCTGVTIGDVLRKLVEEDYEPYKGKIWLEEDVSDFGEDVTELEQAMGVESKTFEVPKPEKTLVEEFGPFDSIDTKAVEEKAAAPPPPPPAEQKVKKDRLVGPEPNELAVSLLDILLRDPEKVYADFSMYRKRLEKIAPWLKPPIGEALACLLLYDIDIRRLPNKAELKDYILHHPTCKKHKDKETTCQFLDELKDNPAKFLDTTAQALIEEVDWRLEKKAWLKAYNEILNEERDIQGARTSLRKFWATSTTQDSHYQPGSFQEKTDTIIDSFHRDVSGELDDRKFRTGFNGIDLDSGMNFGLDGEHSIVMYGPQGGRKTTCALTFGFNFAKYGKHGLFFAGEHHSGRIEKTLYLMYMGLPEVREKYGLVPGLNDWEGFNRKANWDDWEKLRQASAELKAMRAIPGYLEPQNINDIARGEVDRLGAILAYAEATYRKYQWDFIIVDPLDTIMPGTSSSGESNWKACAEIVDDLFDFSRQAFGGKGCMVITTAQFGSAAQRDVAKVQQKNEGADNFDDEIISLLRRDSSIQYFTTIGQRFDLGIGIATSTKKGNNGMMVQGRSRGGGFFDVVNFKIDENSNTMIEADEKVTTHRANGNAMAAEPSMENYDTL
jgi:hypothetical protein